MNPTLLAVAAVAAAYLIGSIPFGYLVARAFAGIDVRTVGSGNIGATNVGRTLGFRFFVLVFVLDLAKGLLPTWGFPRLFTTLSGRTAPDLAVLVAVATIVGHNFPVYLGFKGGKGVATSLGAVLALDAIAALAAGLGFIVALVVCRYVSLSSLLGAIVFCVVHFLRVQSPWSLEQRAMSVITIALVGLMVVRHRKNLGRIVAGTEPKVQFCKPKDEPPRGRIALSWLITLALVGVLGAGAMAFYRKAARPDVLRVGGCALSEVARAATGHQRAERVVFAEGGRLLAVTCPRYNRLVLYRVLDGDSLELLNDLELDGKPVAVCAAADRLFVLERPAGDERHVTPGWWESFDFRGERIGEKIGVGFYPDDMALAPDGRHAFVLTSGQAEGDANKPSPALDVYDLTAGAKAVGHLAFEGPADDPARITLSSSGHCAVVTLLGSNISAQIDLTDPANPSLIDRAALGEVDRPYPSVSDDDSIIMPVRNGREAVALRLEGVGDCVAATLPHDSGLDFSLTSDHRALGRLTLRGGTFGLGMTRPIGLAFSAERRLLAVANRSGSVHLVAIRAR